MCVLNEEKAVRDALPFLYSLAARKSIPVSSTISETKQVQRVEKHTATHLLLHKN